MAENIEDVAESNQNGSGSIQVYSECQQDQEFKSGRWTTEEDRILRDYVMVNGVGKWNLVHKITGLKRDGTSCRHRWTNHLKPGLKRGAFSEDEKELIVKLHAEQGSNWALIATKLPGRSNNAIKNFCNNQLRKMRRQERKQKEPGSRAPSFSTLPSLLHSGVQEEPNQPLDNVSVNDINPLMMSTPLPNPLVHDQNFQSLKVHLENNNNLPLNSFMPVSSSIQLIPFKPSGPEYHSYNSSSVVEGELPEINRNVTAEENNGLLDAICGLACRPIHGGSCSTTPEEGMDREKGKNVDYMPTYRINRKNDINIAEDHWHEMQTSKTVRLNDEKWEDMESLDKHIFGIVDTVRPLILDGINDGKGKDGGRQAEKQAATDDGDRRTVEAPFFQQSSGDAVAGEYVGLEWFLGTNGWNDYFGK